MDILCIAPANLDDVWPHVWPHLERGVAVAGRERVELAADILADRARVWIATGDRPRQVYAAWLTEIVSDGGQRVVVVFGLGGKRAFKWAADVDAKMAEYAAAEGCKVFRFAGSRGWARHLPHCREIGHMDGDTLFERAVA